MNRPVIALIVDNLTVKKWEAEALSQLEQCFSFVLLNCTNTRFSRRPFRHALYYILNLTTLKTAQTRSRPLPKSLDIQDIVSFESEWEGAWQRFPAPILEQMARWQPVLAIKFGMGLLRVPKELDCAILSYHHGDPRQFRGRPAGFYELLNGASMVGQIVQTISNKLDAGNVVAFGQTRVRPYSYRATMAESYGLSPLLLKTAVRNYLSGNLLPIRPEGKNYRLPSNATVVRFAAILVAAKARRFGYGACFEKEWEVAQANVTAYNSKQVVEEIPDRSQWRILKRPRNYRFIADPFPHPRGGIVAEGLRSADGQGEIVHFWNDEPRVICGGAGHFSYPGTITTDKGCFLVPETAEWSPPRIYRFTGGGAEFCQVLDIDRRLRLIDPTFHAHDGRLFLFASDADEGQGVLRLWVADDLFSRFSEHPLSPIRISPKGSRMAGAILRVANRLYRLGQDCTRDYGNGIITFEVMELSPTSYLEVQLGRIGFEDVNGPHTLNVGDGTVIFDFYRHRFSPFAGLRRIRASMSKRRGLASYADTSHGEGHH